MYTKLFVIKCSGDIVHWAVEEKTDTNISEFVKSEFGEDTAWMLSDRNFKKIATSYNFSEVAEICQDFEEDTEWVFIRTSMMARACHVESGAAFDIDSAEITEMIEAAVEKFEEE